MNNKEDDKPIREYQMLLGKVPFTIRIMNEPSPEAIKEFNKRINLIARKYLSKNNPK